MAKGMIGDSFAETLLWIIFFVIAAIGVGFLIKRFT